MLKCTIIAALLVILSGSEVFADGLLGGLVKEVGRATGVKPIEDLGRNMDAEHRRFKENNQIYKDVEEGVSGTVRQVTREAFVESTWPLLETAINLSRNEAIQNGVDTIPPHIRAQLTGFVPEHILNSARYRVGGGGDLSLQVNSFRYGDAVAITLIEVIVFANDNYVEDASLWVHELKHVQQFQSWGLRDFSKRYIRDFGAVEQEARNSADNYALWAQQRVMASGNNLGFPGQQQIRNSNACYAYAGGGCYLTVYAPIGTPCWCGTPWGAAQGAIGD